MFSARVTGSRWSGSDAGSVAAVVVVVDGEAVGDGSDGVLVGPAVGFDVAVAAGLDGDLNRP